MALNEVWVLAEKMSMPLLQNVAIEKIEKISNRMDSIATRTLQYVCDNTADDSLLRRYYVTTIANQLDSFNFRNDPSRFPHAILIDIAMLQADRREISFDINISDFQVEINE